MLALLGSSLMTAQPTTPVIIDTDCGHDDLTAIAFLLARRDVRIEAVTIANGLAHVQAGAANVLRLLALGGRGAGPGVLPAPPPPPTARHTPPTHTPFDSLSPP